MFKLIVQWADGRDCPYCGRMMSLKYGAHDRDFPTRDHIRARIAGGGKRVMVCRRCNLDKGALSLVEWQLRLRQNADPRQSYVARFYFRWESGEVDKDIEAMEKELEQIAQGLNTRKGMVARVARAIKRAGK